MKYTVNINTLVDTITLSPNNRKINLDKHVTERIVKEVSKIILNEGDEVEINIKKLVGFIEVKSEGAKNPPKQNIWDRIMKKMTKK